MNNQELRELLHQHEMRVTFTKANGEQRVMPCTLKNDLLPPTPVTESTRKANTDPDLFKVFCTDRKEWRSFRFERVISAEVIA
jgi:hypothetical protein